MGGFYLLTCEVFYSSIVHNELFMSYVKANLDVTS